MSHHSLASLIVIVLTVQMIDTVLFGLPEPSKSFTLNCYRLDQVFLYMMHFYSV